MEIAKAQEKPRSCHRRFSLLFPNFALSWGGCVWARYPQISPAAPETGKQRHREHEHRAGVDPSPTNHDGRDLRTPQGAGTWDFSQAPKATSCETPVGLSNPSTGTRSPRLLGPAAGLGKTCSPLFPARFPAAEVVLQAQKRHSGGHKPSLPHSLLQWEGYSGDTPQGKPARGRSSAGQTSGEGFV